MATEPWESPYERYNRTMPRSGGGLDFSGFKAPNLIEIGSGLMGKLTDPFAQSINAATMASPLNPVATTRDIGDLFAGRQIGPQYGTDRGAGSAPWQGPVFRPPTATGVDPMYGAALGQAAPLQPGANYVGQNLQDMRQQWFQERQGAINDAVSAVNAQYAGPLDELRDRLAKYQVGDNEIQAAYGEFQASIEDVGVGVDEAEGLVDTGVVEAVATSYDQAEGSLGQAFAKIDSNGNPGMSQALQQELTQFETVITDSLMTDLATSEDLHGLSSDYAEALAGFAYSDDKYRAESERVLIKAQFDKAIKDQQDAIKRTEKEMAEAAARARQGTMDQWGEFEMDLDTARTEAFREYALSSGLTEEEAAANWNIVSNIMGEHGASIVTAADFRKYANLTVNSSNFAKMGLDVALQNYLSASPDMGDPQATAQEEMRRQTLVNNIVDRDWSGAIRGKGSQSMLFQSQLTGMGINAEAMFQKMWDNPQEFDSMAENKMLMDGWNVWTKTEDNWAQVQATGAASFTDDQLAKAPSGYTFPIVGFNWGSGGGFGYVKPSGRTHQGVDIGGHRGAPVVSSTNGKIEKIGWHDMSGWYVRVRDTEGNLHKYMHLDQDPRGTISQGASVQAGAQIGAVGRTGNASGGGPHLHYEIWDRSGTNLDPAKWLGPTGGWNVSDPPSDAYRGY